MQASLGTAARYLGVSTTQSPSKEISAKEESLRFSPKLRINQNVTQKRSLNAGLFDPMCSSSSSLTSDRMVKEKSSTSMSDLEDSTASTDSPSDPGKAAAAAASKTNNSQSSSPRQQQQQQQQQQMPDSFRNSCEQLSSSVLHEDDAEAKLRLGKKNIQKYFSGEPASTSSDAEKPDRDSHRHTSSSPSESSDLQQQQLQLQLQRQQQQQQQQQVGVGPMSDLTSKIHELHATLDRLRKESEDQIEKLRQESENASKTIERLQSQLQQQSDYNLLKREIQLLRTAGGASIGDPTSNAILAAAMGNHPLTSTPSSTTSSLTLTPPPPVPLTSGPPSGGSPSSLATGVPPSSLEQLLVERAKAIRQANPALKALADIQGPPQFAGLGGPIRHPLFHPHAGMQSMEALGLMNEEMVAQWRQSLQRSPLGGLGINVSPYHHLTNPSNSRPSNDSHTPLPTSAPMTPPASGLLSGSGPGPRTPLHNQKFSDSSPDRAGSPSNGHSSPNPDDRPDSASNFTPNATNGGSNAQSDCDEASSPIRLESKSPFKCDERPSPSLPMNFPGPPGLNLQFPLHMSVSPLVSSGGRIPKSDPMEGRLQDMLRYNMEKYAGQALDTLGTSRRVRELLSIHNIGQRLFAKYVLGLSQGTVSELLSKPKCWEKLTEKGRDSYRKMHAWAYDENAVMMLKSLIPRKGELMRPISANPLLIKDRQQVNPGFPFGPDGSEERIAKILNEANKAMASNSGKDMMPGTPPTSSAPLSFSSQLLGSSPLCDDNPHENISKIYKEEFSRIMQESGRLTDKQSPEGLVPGPPPGLPFFPGLGAGGFFQRGAPPTDFARAMDIYHQEFSRLQQNALAAALRAHQSGDGDIPGFAASVSSRDEASNSMGRDDGDDPNDGNDPDDKPCSPDDRSDRSGANSPSDCGQDSPLGKGPGSKLFPPPPLQHIGDDLAGSLSPLQRMASITNSLVSQPNLPSQAGQQHRTHRAILPPITQQQFDRFQHLNTDDVVRRVKEILSQYSISQRLFGEHVLALSQGSVSDLLARPKPWHMLTQKGREPFIRMKLFLDDENAVHKLVASQYKIAPDKLMRTGNYSGQLQMPPKQLGKMPEFHHAMHEVLPSSFRFTQESIQDRSPPILDPLAIQRKLLSQKSNANLGAGGVAPSLYEMAALTHELDTQGVTTKVKEILLANNVGQKLFGEAVLGLSQGSVSELLSKPKPWHMLSIKGREPFIRMQLWLNDPHNIEKLQALKNERKDNYLSKRKRGMDSSSDRSSPADSSDMYANPVDSPGSAKKQRVLFSDEQKEALNVAFTLEPYPSTATMDFLSQELNLEPRSISNWFHNHRMRLKQHMPPGTDSLNLFSGKESQTFDPVKFRLLFHQRMLDARSDDSGSRGTTDQEMGMGGLQQQQTNFTSILRQFGSLHSSIDQLCPKEPRDEKDLVSSGLDLTFKRDHDNDKDSIAESQSEDSNQETATSMVNLKHENNLESESEDSSMHGGGRPDLVSTVNVSSRSRRKPAAPQWVRPDWMESDGAETENGKTKIPLDEESGRSRLLPKPTSAALPTTTSTPTTTTTPTTGVSDKENNLTINGVCVMNSYALNNKSFDKSPVATDKQEEKSESIL